MAHSHTVGKLFAGGGSQDSEGDRYTPGQGREDRNSAAKETFATFAFSSPKYRSDREGPFAEKAHGWKARNVTAWMRKRSDFQCGKNTGFKGPKTVEASRKSVGQGQKILARPTGTSGLMQEESSPDIRKSSCPTRATADHRYHTKPLYDHRETRQSQGSPAIRVVYRHNKNTGQTIKLIEHHEPDR